MRSGTLETNSPFQAIARNSVPRVVAGRKGVGLQIEVEVYEAAANEPVSETMLREALTVRATRRVRKDCTLSVAGTDFEVDASYLAGRVVTLARVLLDPSAPPWIEHEDQRLALRPVDPRANAKRARKTSKRAARGIDAVPFVPNGARIDALVRGAR